eukprot:m.72324 g.72324  ORF g.72324 m.72324 type:complete len:54 (+) comp14251_c0_seq1:545-706(+)
MRWEHSSQNIIGSGQKLQQTTTQSTTVMLHAITATLNPNTLHTVRALIQSYTH